VEENNDVEFIILELSSFQLESSSHLRLDGAIIINISPDHLDRHESLQDYESAKLKIRDFLKVDGCLVAHEDLKEKLSFDQRAQFFSPRQLPSDLSDAIKGIHNQENAIAALSLSSRFNISKLAILQGLTTYTPLPHRCEFLGRKNGVQFINDSKGTTVEAVKKALTLVNEPIHLLLGGIAKGESFSSLCRENFPHVARYYVYGRDQQKILADLSCDIAEAHSDLSHAFFAALNKAQAGQTILLSPGCASYDQFEDYQHRGNLFKSLMQKAYECSSL
jgi:UDP-N-acetylmuramoylalanine--D-glutamate ligase